MKKVRVYKEEISPPTTEARCYCGKDPCETALNSSERCRVTCTKSSSRVTTITAIVLGGLLLLTLILGCAGRSETQRAVVEWQTEGHYVYRVDGNREYFVRCADGEKYLGFWVPETGFYQAYGPIDICTGEEE